MSGIEFVGIILSMKSALGILISALQEGRANSQKGYSYSQKLSALAALLDEINTIVTNANASPTKTAELFLHNCQHELKVIEECCTGGNSHGSGIFPTAQHGLTRAFLLDHHAIDQEAFRDSLSGFESSVALLHNIVSHTEMHRQLADLQMQHQRISCSMESLTRDREHNEGGKRARTALSFEKVTPTPEKHSNDKKPLKVTGGILDGFLVNDSPASRIETPLVQLKNLTRGGSGQADSGQATPSFERAAEIPSLIPVRFLVDTGSDVNIVSRDFINRNNLSGLVKRTSPKVITGASRDMITQSAFTTKFTWRHKPDTDPRTDTFHVLEKSTHDAVLGRPFWNDTELYITQDTTFRNSSVENHQVNAAKLSTRRKRRSVRRREKRKQELFNEEADMEAKWILAGAKSAGSVARNPPSITPQTQGPKMTAETTLEGTHKPEPLARRPSRSTINDESQCASTPRSTPLPPSKVSSEEIKSTVRELKDKPASSEKKSSVRVTIWPQSTPQSSDRPAEVEKAKSRKPWRFKRSKR